MTDTTSRPLVVYLDSSDFSILSNPSKRTLELVNIEKELLSLQDKGLIEFRFSFAHILESAPISKESIQYSKQRFAYIQSICENRCVASHIEIIENEINAISINSTHSQSTIYNDCSMWFPSSDVRPESDLESIIKTIKEEISSLPDRKQRRLATKKSFLSNGQLNKSNFLKNHQVISSISLDIEEKFPLTRKEVEEYVNSMFSKNDIESCRSLLINSLKDIGRFGNWYEKQWDRTFPVSSHLRNIGSDLRDALMVASEKVRQISSELKEAGHHDDEVEVYSKKIISDLSKSLPISLVKGLAKKIEVEIDIEKMSWSLTPSLLTVCNLMTVLTAKSLVNGERNRNPKASDFGDVTHAYYLPYVDFFRTDKFMAAVLKESKNPLETVVVDSLEQLVIEIRKKLES